MRYSAAEELEIIRLVEQAHLSVRRVAVLGEATPDRPFTDSSPPNPRDSFGVSKWEAEQALSEIAGRFKMGVVILRPPLVYGLGVKGNFRSLMRFVDPGRAAAAGEYREPAELALPRQAWSTPSNGAWRTAPPRGGPI